MWAKGNMNWSEPKRRNMEFCEMLNLDEAL